jgi:RNase adaptor protein for sRNA GlmZ degradation
VCGISDHKRARSVDLRGHTGLNEDVQKMVKSSKRFDEFFQQIINTIENQNLHCISINCHKGRYRSVSVACLLKKCYPLATGEHLELKRKLW